MARRSYSPEEKAAVLAALLAGQAESFVAKEYNIPIGTVKGWKHREINSKKPNAVVTQKKEAIGDLILGLLSSELITLNSMVLSFADPAWLKSQNAADVAVLYGVIQDKVFRKLEAMANVSSDTDTND